MSKNLDRSFDLLSQVNFSVPVPRMEVARNENASRLVVASHCEQDRENILRQISDALGITADELNQKIGDQLRFDPLDIQIQRLQLLDANVRKTLAWCQKSERPFHGASSQPTVTSVHSADIAHPYRDKEYVNSDMLLAEVDQQLAQVGSGDDSSRTKAEEVYKDIFMSFSHLPEDTDLSKGCSASILTEIRKKIAKIGNNKRSGGKKSHIVV